MNWHVLWANHHVWHGNSIDKTPVRKQLRVLLGSQTNWGMLLSIPSPSSLQFYAFFYPDVTLCSEKYWMHITNWPTSHFKILVAVEKGNGKSTFLCLSLKSLDFKMLRHTETDSCQFTQSVKSRSTYLSLPWTTGWPELCSIEYINNLAGRKGCEVISSQGSISMNPKTCGQKIDSFCWSIIPEWKKVEYLMSKK